MSEVTVKAGMHHASNPGWPQTVLPRGKRDSLREAATMLVLAIVAALPYLNSLTNGFVYDDATQVLNNPYLRSFHYIPEILAGSAWSYLGGADAVTNYYRPLMSLGYLLCFQTFGPSAFAFHCVSLGLHLAVVLLVFKLSEQMFHDRGLAIAAALLFALHPIHTESVDWIAAVTDLELSFFYLLAFWLYLRLPPPSASGLRRAGAQAALVVSLAFAMLSKEQALTFPVLATLYEHFYREDRTETTVRQKVARYAPAWLLVPVYLLVRIRSLGGFAPSTSSNHASDEVLLSAAGLLGQYVGKLLWPVRLCAFYVFPKSWTALLPWVLGGMAAFLVATLIFVVLWRKAHPASFGLAWFVLTLAPVLNVRWMPAGVFAERYLYLPSVGFCWVLAWAFRRLWNAASGHAKVWQVALASTAAVLAALAVGRISTRNPDWKDDVQLYRRTLEVSPDAYVIRNNLGEVYWKQGRKQLAEQEWLAALRLDPDADYVLANLGLALSDEGRYAEAIADLKRAIELRPKASQAHVDLGMTYHEMGLLKNAERELETAVRLSPLSVLAHQQLGEVYFDEGRFAEAETEFRASLSSQPTLNAWFSLGLARWRQGDAAEAERDFKAAQHLDPADGRAHFMLGLLYGATGRYSEAVSEYEAGFRLDPSNPQAQAAFQRLQSEMQHANTSGP
jgi:protein O-mannosyl-transferase